MPNIESRSEAPSPVPETAPEPNTALAVEKHRLRLPHFGLSATQLIAAALAAITATVAGSYLGVSGTVVGAAIASVLTAIGNAVYGQSLRSTRDRVLVPVTRHIPGVTTTSLPVAGPPAAVPPVLPVARPRPERSALWRRTAVGAVGGFVVIMAVVTGVELLAGRPVSDIARGDSGGGTSVFGAHTVTTRTVSPATTPTVTVTVTPKVVFTTPTVTQAAPTVTRTSSGTATATVSPSATSTSTPTASDTPSSTQTPSGSATP